MDKTSMTGMHYKFSSNYYPNPERSLASSFFTFVRAGPLCLHAHFHAILFRLTWLLSIHYYFTLQGTILRFFFLLQPSLYYKLVFGPRTRFATLILYLKKRMDRDHEL